MNKGVVKFFNDSKGFGFIQMEGESNDIFVHVSGLIDDIRDNDVVLFDIKEGRRGPNAINVKLAE